MRKPPSICICALWLGLGLLFVLMLPPRTLLVLTAGFLIVLGLCCHRR